MILRDIHALHGRQYSGDYAACDVLADLATAIERASLTNRQRQALALVYVEDLTQEEAGKRMGISQPSLKLNETAALTKIAEVYEKWTWESGEYVVKPEKNVSNIWSGSEVLFYGNLVKINHGKRRVVEW